MTPASRTRTARGRIASRRSPRLRWSRDADRGRGDELDGVAPALPEELRRGARAALSRRRLRRGASQLGVGGRAAARTSSTEGDQAIVACRTGRRVDPANKVPGIRAALCGDAEPRRGRGDGTTRTCSRSVCARRRRPSFWRFSMRGLAAARAPSQTTSRTSPTWARSALGLAARIQRTTTNVPDPIMCP